MKKFFRHTKGNPWLNSWLSFFVLTTLWVVFGWLFGRDTFDSYPSLKVLSQKSDVLTFATVLFAILIPVFILLLQRMAEAGYIRRHVLPRVIRFRELLTGFITLSLLLMISPRTSFYYFPVVALVLLSFHAVVNAIKVLFEPRELKGHEEEFVKGIVERVIDEKLNDRISSNTFFDQLKQSRGPITHVMLYILSEDQQNPFDIRASRAGRITSVDIQRLEEIVLQNYSKSFSEIETSPRRETPKKQAEKLQLVLYIRPGSLIKPQERLMQLFIPEKAEAPSERLKNKLIDALEIEKDVPYSPDKQLDDLIIDFKQQLRDAIDRDNMVALNQSLDFYRLLLAGYSRFSRAVADSEYTFANAREEFHQFFGDSISKQITAVSDIYNDEMQYAVREKKQDTTQGLIRFAYSELLEATYEFEVLRAAFADDAIISTATRLVIADSADTFSHGVFEEISRRLKEHTGQMLYKYRISDGGVKKEQLEEWLIRRINDLRSLLLNAYNRSKPNLFTKVLSTFEEFEDNNRYHAEDIEDLIKLSRCQLLLVAAYMHGKSNELSDSQQMRDDLYSLLNRFSPVEITSLLIECINKDYADKWRIDVYDLPHDGRVHEVPDYKRKLKEVWINYMLEKGGFPAHLSDYSEVQLGETATFSDNMPNPGDSYLVQRLNELEGEKPDAQKLKKLVLAFIQVRKQWEGVKLAEANLSDSEIKEFREEVLKGYESRALAVKIFEQAGKLIRVQKTNGKYTMLGWNQVYDKAAFIKDWHIGYVMAGEQQGSEIALRQNEILAKSLLKRSVTTRSLEEWLSKISKKNKWVVFHVGVGGWYLRSSLRDHLRSKTSSPGSYNEIFFKGVNQFGPSTAIHEEGLPKGIYAVQVDHLGILKVKPSNRDLVEVTIDAYSHNKGLLENMLNEPTEWLRSKGSKEEQESFLKTQVRMYIYHTFKYEPHKSSKVYFFPIEEIE